MIEPVLEAYGLENVKAESFGNGLINSTWKLSTPLGEFILQRVHDGVFKKPADIAFNIRLVADYLEEHFPDYFFVSTLPSTRGEDIVWLKDKGYFRLFPFVPGSHSNDTVDSPSQAFEAAAQFGKFSRLLAHFDAGQLRTTIPDFHNLELRYRQFNHALKLGNKQRIAGCKGIIDELLAMDDIVKQFQAIQKNPGFKKRVTHHDTKISNVLFDQNEKAICVIDLDTVMPGLFISDVGDMMRTYLSPVNEEEKDFSKITIRADFYEAIVEGYLQEMNEELTPTEKEHFHYAGQFMIYMQALRFLTDHLNNDVYYGAKYEGQNFVRAGNQLTLLRRLMQRIKN